MILKDLPTNELPRERLLNNGVDSLTNEELISIILRTGYKNNSVKEISTQILNRCKNINSLNDITLVELSKIKGVGIVKAITIKASIELGRRVNNKEILISMQLNNSEIVHNTFKSMFNNLNQEKLLAIYLDNKKRLIKYKIVSIGTIDQTIFHPRDIMRDAIKNNASAIIIMHNHPSGDISPSNKDIEMTNILVDSSKIIGIPLIDHLITNTIDYYSFFEGISK